MQLTLLRASVRLMSHGELAVVIEICTDGFGTRRANNNNVAKRLCSFVPPRDRSRVVRRADFPFDLTAMHSRCMRSSHRSLRAVASARRCSIMRYFGRGEHRNNCRSQIPTRNKNSNFESANPLLPLFRLSAIWIIYPTVCVCVFFFLFDAYANSGKTRESRDQFHPREI